MLKYENTNNKKNVKLLNLNPMKTANEICNEYGLDFGVEKKQLSYFNNGQQFNTSKNAIIRTDNGKMLSVVDRKYHIITYCEAVQNIMDALQVYNENSENKLSLIKAGELDGGKKMFVQFKVGDTFKVNGDDTEQYITIFNSYDKTISYAVGIGYKRMTCQNQFYKLLKKSQFHIRHLSNANMRIEEMKNNIQYAINNNQNLIEKLNRFAKVQIDQKYIIEHIKKITGKEENNILLNDIKLECDKIGYNLWGLHNGITRYVTHSMPTRKGEKGKFRNIILGRGFELANRSFNLMEAELEEA